MEYSYNYNVVKIHEEEKYAAAIRADKEDICRTLAGVWTNDYNAAGLKNIHFEAVPSDRYDAMVDTERRGGKSVYEQIKGL